MPLGDHLVESKFDLRKLMRSIMRSRVYQLSSNAPPEKRGVVASTRTTTSSGCRGPRACSTPLIPPVWGPRAFLGACPWAPGPSSFPDPNFNSYFLDTLGRPQRAIACECERTAEPNLAQVLHIANGELLSRKLADKTGRISQLAGSGTLEKKRVPGRAIHQLYLSAYSRPPLPTNSSSAGRSSPAPPSLGGPGRSAVGVVEQSRVPVQPLDGDLGQCWWCQVAGCE
ncbi:MAG: hypothetical protein Ct9H300mP1_33450 [Planctomycetaceae bacterium]|nr:MAG: hypothetical protein Ct9H300mP1_33450 [Planctomycetaceae bacterium]